jgi:hypothetical protein
MLPAAAPVVVGANCAENDMDWPAGRVAGKERPAIPKALPDTLAILMTTFEFPVFVKRTFSEVLWPTVMLPKFQVAGETDRPAWAPVPVKEIARGELDASLITVMAPLVAPEAVGANWICIDTLCPTGIAPEGFPPTTVKAAPVIVARETLTVAVPVFVTVRVCIAVVATATSPKLRVVLLAERTPELDPVPGPVFAALV